jgi:hypothetical protein
MTFATTARKEAVELALELLDAGEDKNDLYSVYLTIATALLTCNNEIIRTELKKMMND